MQQGLGDAEEAARRWRAQGSVADLERVLAAVEAGLDAGRVRELLGEPLVVSTLAGGGESWLYLRGDDPRADGQSLSVGFDEQGRCTGVRRKPVF